MHHNPTWVTASGSEGWYILYNGTLCRAETKNNQVSSRNGSGIPQQGRVLVIETCIRINHDGALNSLASVYYALFPLFMVHIL